MLLNNGTVTLCKLKNKASKGNAPRNQLVPFARFWYGERTVGYGRQYAAKAVNEQVDMLIRIRGTSEPKIGQYAVLGNGDQFRIQNIAQLHDEATNLKVTDLTLQRLEDYYDVLG